MIHSEKSYGSLDLGQPKEIMLIYPTVNLPKINSICLQVSECTSFNSEVQLH